MLIRIIGQIIFNLQKYAFEDILNMRYYALKKTRYDGFVCFTTLRTITKNANICTQGKTVNNIYIKIEIIL